MSQLPSGTRNQEVDKDKSSVKYIPYQSLESILASDASSCDSPCPIKAPDRIYLSLDDYLMALIKMSFQLSELAVMFATYGNRIIFNFSCNLLSKFTEVYVCIKWLISYFFWLYWYRRVWAAETNSQVPASLTGWTHVNSNEERSSSAGVWPSKVSSAYTYYVQIWHDSYYFLQRGIEIFQVRSQNRGECGIRNWS